MKITIEQLEFPISVKDKITKIPNISNLDIKFINGKYIHFSNTNISINDPHKIIISNNSYCLILLSYENDNNFYLKDSLKLITLNEIKTIISKII